MSIQDILKRCASGHMPRVAHSKFGAGQVVTIKTGSDAANGRAAGCAVKFDNEKYEQWFHQSNETDRRTKYVYELCFETAK